MTANPNHWLVYMPFLEGAMWLLKIAAVTGIAYPLGEAIMRWRKR